MTSEQAVETAVNARVDAIGFVFAPSSRRLEPERAAQLAAPARGRVSCIAVTLHPAQTLLDRILQVFAPDALQTDLEDLAELRLPSSLQLLPVVRGGTMPGGAMPGRLLYEGARSGSGSAADWQQAARLAAASQVILAGGLDAHNVAAAIGAVRPFGVDVSTGVESAPGHKSPQKIVEFVQAARAAFAGMEHEFNRNRS
ncbi:MAG TPA: phosphoribosylanthranilate isomerase [Steroidobacteraceae bacterium]